MKDRSCEAKCEAKWYRPKPPQCWQCWYTARYQWGRVNLCGRHARAIQCRLDKGQPTDEIAAVYGVSDGRAGRVVKVEP